MRLSVSVMKYVQDSSWIEGFSLGAFKQHVPLYSMIVLILNTYIGRAILLIEPTAVIEMKVVSGTAV